MKRIRLLCVLVMIAAAAVLGGCEKEGPAERAGEEIDEAAEETADAAEEAADRAEDAVDR